MKENKVVEIVENIALPIVNNLGYDLIDVEYKKIGTDMTLIIFIDKPEGINLSDCEIVSKALDEKLDEADPTNGITYNFNVSSPG
jgi:ribosome maturation factor RimP